MIKILTRSFLNGQVFSPPLLPGFCADACSTRNAASGQKSLPSSSCPGPPDVVRNFASPLEQRPWAVTSRASVWTAGSRSRSVLWRRACHAAPRLGVAGRYWKQPERTGKRRFDRCWTGIKSAHLANTEHATCQEKGKRMQEVKRSYQLDKLVAHRNLPKTFTGPRFHENKGQPRPVALNR